MSERDHIEAFRKAMYDAGVRYSGPIEGDGKRRRIHLDDDKEGRKNGWYIVHLDERPAGAFGSWKGVKCNWSAEGLKPMTDAERAAMRERQRRDREAAAKAEAERNAAAAVLARRIWQAAAPANDHPYLTRKGVPAYGLRVGTWEKELRPDPRTGEVRVVRHENALLIPLRDGPATDEAITSLQAVFAKPVKISGEERDKDFVFGGRKKGCWFSIGKPTEIDGRPVIVVCEGYATGASIHHATGFAVMVAFDAGNLQPVAERVREAFPEAIIVIAADNDQFTRKPDGAPWNPGLEKAMAAAEAVQAYVAVPTFKVLDTKPTDFNDLDVNEGLEEVARQIMASFRPEPVKEPEAESAVPVAAGAEEEQNGPVDETYFRVLGHDRENLYVYQRQMRMVVGRKLTDGSEPGLLALAPLDWWEMEFPADNGINKKMAQNWLVQTAFARGYFDPDSLRGRGAWRDDGRIVYHFGNKLMVDEELMDVSAIKSSYVYEQTRRLRLPADEPMTAADGKLIAETAKLFAWSRPASALLLAGWVALAPLCGALRWRPHIWITGGPGSGKSTILNEFVDCLLNGACVYAQGASTEAGIRQTLRIDALPFLFEESEQNNEREVMRVQNIIAMLRQASTKSRAQTLKGTVEGRAQRYEIRSMGCMCSIQVKLDHQADLERITVLALKPMRRDGKAATEAWARIRSALEQLKADPELPARLLKRSLQLLPVTLENIEVFAKVAAEKFGSQREGDQYGAMLAGAWSLTKTTKATPQEARELIDRFDWSDYLEGSEVDESAKALNALLEARIRMPRGMEMSVYELLEQAALSGSELEREEADRTLRRHGIMTKVDAAGVKWMLVANGATDPARLVAHTPYTSDLKGQLLRVPGARKYSKNERFLSLVSKSVAIPLSAIFDPPAPSAGDMDDEIAFDSAA